ncbi:AbrB/MazE/SpoVT family DNA-binding domain-containing protein [Caballeronia sordidicola]|uniref:AbrB/MazE/SpoVT family DNA-binding domain-containing protein n=1 Tax=Caballeronia sordidicola TaxID=196367 RepID=UPI000A3CD6A7|nr:AbrB/MazE/SpoVT family DNA-binding domain-containing protein [Caballeronia sordidicola]
MKTVIRKMGNSQGILIPKPILAQLGFEDEVDMEVVDESIVLRRPSPKVRAGWAQASKEIAGSNDDALVMGEFANDSDAELAW